MPEISCGSPDANAGTEISETHDAAAAAAITFFTVDFFLRKILL